jgi:cyanophycin synthetase
VEEAIAAFHEFGAPVVVKPLDGNQGRGVSLNLASAEQVAEAFAVAREHSEQVIVETVLTGRDYRVLIIGGRFRAASEKTPANVIGDGRHTIEQLIEIANRDPRRSQDHSKPLSCIEVDAVMKAYLRNRGRSLDSIPAGGEAVLLREGANLSTGGEAADVTEGVHPENARLFERAARIIGLDVCGLDLVMPDIAKPFSDPQNATGGIIEVNAAPGIRMHCYPSRGTPRDVGADIVEMIFPHGSNGRIPIISVTGTNGKTSVVRMVAHAISSTGKTVGMTDTESITIAGGVVARGDMSGPQSARDVLRDPLVEVAVLETARGGIVKAGLGYDWSDVGVLTNIQLDHLGQDGIASLDDVARIKGLVAERVRVGGTIVLNADDPILADFPDRPRIANLRREIVFFSMDARNPVVRRHVANGETAFVLHRGLIEERHGEEVSKICDASSLAVTWGGLVKSEIANALAAIAACSAYGMSPFAAADALRSFQNARLEAFECRGRLVLLDYGHNAAAIAEMGQVARELDAQRRTCVLGLPGDRSDQLVIDTTREAAVAFDRLVLREDSDLRGRQPGELAALMRSAALEVSDRLEISTVLDEVAALDWSLQHSDSGELIVVFYEHRAPLVSYLENSGAERLSDRESLRHVLERHLLLSA